MQMQRKWVGLTDADIKLITNLFGVNKIHIRAIERELKRKNANG
jgi:hypothetical protein